MLSKHINYYILISLAVLASACGVTNQTQQNTVPTAALSNDPVVTKLENNRIFIWAALVSLPEGMTQDDYSDVYRQYLKSVEYQQHERIIRTISTTNSWREAHQFTQKFISETRDDRFTFIHQQYAAASILRNFFMYIKPSRESQEVMAYYLDILKRYKSFQEINLIVQILPKMQGYWTDEKITEYAKVAIGDYNTRRSIPITGQPFSTEKYFTEKAQNLVKSGNSLNSVNGASSVSDSDIRETAKKLRTSFVGDIDTMLDKARTFDTNKFSRDWLIPKWDSIVLLGLLAEGSLNKQ